MEDGHSTPMPGPQSMGPPRWAMVGLAFTRRAIVSHEIQPVKPPVAAGSADDSRTRCIGTERAIASLSGGLNHGL